MSDKRHRQACDERHGTVCGFNAVWWFLWYRFVCCGWRCCRYSTKTTLRRVCAWIGGNGGAGARRELSCGGMWILQVKRSFTMIRWPAFLKKQRSVRRRFTAFNNVGFWNNDVQGRFIEIAYLILVFWLFVGNVSECIIHKLCSWDLVLNNTALIKCIAEIFYILRVFISYHIAWKILVVAGIINFFSSIWPR